MDPVIGTILVGVLSLIGTCVGSIAGIMTAQKMTTYRIDQLEKKVDKMNDFHSSISERVLVLEKDNLVQWDAIKELQKKL